MNTKLLPVITIISFTTCMLFFNIRNQHRSSITPKHKTEQSEAKKIKTNNRNTNASNGLYNNEVPYNKTLEGIKTTWKTLSKKVNIKHATITDSFYSIFMDRLLPYWYNTPWDFNGTTTTPKQGHIACGYFVATMLQHAGVTLNRVKTAQKASSQIIHSLINKKYTENLAHLTFDAFIKHVQKRKKGIYIVGLDFHVGFLVNTGTELYFVHSNYIKREGVVKEKATESIALKQSKWHYMGYITEDENFMRKLLG
jgi:hypothetical protein